MSTQQDADRSPRLLWTVVVVMLAAAAILWGASALVWAGRQYRTPFSGEITATATGSMLRPELVPLALVTLAALAAVLATSGWLRRLVGLLIGLAGALLLWRCVSWFAAASFTGGNVPPGSTPVSAVSTNPSGPVLMAIGALTLVGAGLVVLLRAPRMPGMGTKYAAPATRKVSGDPDKRWWEALDHGEDPTV